MRMPFGRYEGQTLEEIADADLDYLRWLLREEVGPEELRAEAARVLEARTYPATQHRPLRGQGPPWLWGLAGAVLGALVMLVAGRLLAPTGTLAPESANLQPIPPTAAVTTANRRQPTATVVSAIGGQRSAVASQVSPTGVTVPPQVPTRPAARTLRTPVAPTPAGDPCEARQEGTLSPEEVADYIGEYRSVQFRVVRTHNSGKAVFLNSHDPWQGHFEVVIFPDRWAEFPQPPEDLFLNRCIVVYGKLQLYRGTPEIVLQSADHIHTVE
ncbi:MAG: hypothetical protein ACE5OS_15265 [Anaerolineae bacterium]